MQLLRVFIIYDSQKHGITNDRAMRLSTDKLTDIGLPFLLLSLQSSVWFGRELPLSRDTKICHAHLGKPALLTFELIPFFISLNHVLE